jgi:hypothetical protein
MSTFSSGFIIPASMRMKVDFPVPFWPSITIISESEKLPLSTCNKNQPKTKLMVATHTLRLKPLSKDFFMVG